MFDGRNSANSMRDRRLVEFSQRFTGVACRPNFEYHSAGNFPTSTKFQRPAAYSVRNCATKIESLVPRNQVSREPRSSN